MALLKIIEWLGAPNTIVYKYATYDNAVERGSRLVVREGQAAIFCDKGKLADVFGPGTYSLDARTIPILTRLMAWRFAFETPFKSDIYFINTAQFSNLKWGTATPIIIRDKDYGAIRIRAYGTYAFHVTDPYKFLTVLMGVKSTFVTSDITDYIRSLLVMGLSDAIGESGVPILDMAGNLMELSSSVCSKLESKITNLGIELDTFVFESVSLPPELEKAFDENARLNVLGKNAEVYRKLAEADAIREAAKNNSAMGSVMSATMGAAMGFGLGAKLTAEGEKKEAPAVSVATSVCPACGKTIPASSKFCPECGTAVAKKFCPECGAKLTGNAKFCPECGKKL